MSEEEIVVDVGIDNDKVVMNINVCAGSVIMTKENALVLANIIMDYAQKLPDRVGKTN